MSVMTTEEFRQQSKILSNKRNALLEKLVPLARAACNTLKDAKMNATADPIAQVLFEYDANIQEAMTLILENKDVLLECLKESY